MERHFQCIACGRCCQGWLPLTLGDALEHSGRFPLAVVLTPLKQAHRAFALTARLGASLRLRDRRQIAVRIVPTAYIPPTMSCPALDAEGLCTIHEHKPSRCRTMPFNPYHEERDQAEHLVPRKGWTCDVSKAAPVVYRDRTIVDRRDFDRERGELLDQAPLLRAHLEWLAGHVPGLAETLAAAAMKPGGGHVVTGFAPLLRRLEQVDRAAVARAQRPLLVDFAARTAGVPALAEYHRFYGDGVWEMERLAET
ncbi:MAG: YkgJ family cysteine cluster protein [Alphaproteobacteria bacterium]